MNTNGEAANSRVAVVPGQRHLTALVQLACRIESQWMRGNRNAFSQNLADGEMQPHLKLPVRNFKVGWLVHRCTADCNPVRLQLQQHFRRYGWRFQKREAKGGIA